MASGNFIFDIRMDVLILSYLYIKMKRSTTSTLIFVAYVLYNIALLTSIVFFVNSMKMVAVLIILTVVSLHFLLGAVQTIANGFNTSVKERFGMILSPSVRCSINFRHATTLLGDTLLLVAFGLSVLLLTGNRADIWYGVSTTCALSGNWICNLLHIFPTQSQAENHSSAPTTPDDTL